MNPAIVQRDPKLLRAHPFIRQMPRWAKDSPEWGAFLESIQQDGIKVPLSITRRNEVADGETRRQAAVALNMHAVPCIEVPDDEVAGTAMRELQFRRNLTRGQRAYLAVPMAEALLEEIRARQMVNLRRGNESPCVHSVNEREDFWNLDDFARSLGFSKVLLWQARRLHDVFDKNPELKEELEPKILDMEAPLGLGFCLAGIAGKKATKGEPRRVSSDLDLFTNAWDVLGKRFGYWAEFDEAQQPQSIKAIRDAIAKASPSLRATIRRETIRADQDAETANSQGQP